MAYEKLKPEIQTAVDKVALALSIEDRDAAESYYLDLQGDFKLKKFETIVIKDAIFAREKFYRAGGAANG